jgi:hypothetical protein
MRWGSAVTYIAYAALAVALASSGLACASGSASHPSGVGPPAPTGPERTAPHPPLASVSSIAPRSGVAGSRVTISGSGFTSRETVCFGSASSPNYRVSDSGRRIAAVVPSGFGTVPVAVITAAGASAAGPDDTFTYHGAAVSGGATSSALAAPQCASVAPETQP